MQGTPSPGREESASFLGVDGKLSDLVKNKNITILALNLFQDSMDSHSQEELKQIQFRQLFHQVLFQQL